MDIDEIQALIGLLDDPDEQVFEQVKDKIVSLGEDIIPSLEGAWEENSFGPLYLERIEDIIHNIQFDNVEARLRQWALYERDDLLAGAMLIARYQYPDLDEDEVRDQINKIRQDIWLELNDNLTSFEKVKVMNHILFDVHGFTGNKKNYHAPQNSYLNEVLQTKKGNPLSLSVIYQVLAESLDIPIKGVNLPNHFILAYQHLQEETNKPGETEKRVLFYVNPFSKGAILGKSEIDMFLKQLELDPKPSYYEPCTPVQVIVRKLNNLIYSYKKLGYVDKVEELTRLLDAVTN